MGDVIDYKIHGDDVQFVQIVLDPGETIVAEAGTMLFKDVDVEMQTSIDGGVMKGLGRIATGESFFITSFTNKSSSGKRQVSFAAPYGGKIIKLDLSELGGEFLCQKDSFLCAVKGMDIGIAFTKKLGAGIFGGEGFILQKLTGNGVGFVHAGGTLVKMELQEGKSIDVDTGCIVGFSPSVDYDIKFIGGVKNVLFGGEGFFLARLTGPGLVYLQSLPFSRMADRIIAASGAIGKKGEVGLGGLGDAGQMLGSLGGLIGKN